MGKLLHQISIFLIEARFIDNVMAPVRKQFPALKIVFEHITTKEAAQYVLEEMNFLVQLLHHNT